MVPNFDSITEFMKWLVYSGGAVLFVSWLLDQFPKFALLPSKVKYYIAMGLSIAVALGIFALIVFVPAAVWAMLDPWFAVITGTIVVYSAGQVYHQQMK